MPERVKNQMDEQRIDAEAADDHAQEIRARALLAAAHELGGRHDLFELAIEIRTVMLESHRLMMRATRLRRDARSEAERQDLTRIIDAALARHADTSERFQLVEAAMDAETRIDSGAPSCKGGAGTYSRASCCRSSVVEHPLGKGEVVSSILTGSTSTPRCRRRFCLLAVQAGLLAAYGMQYC